MKHGQIIFIRNAIWCVKINHPWHNWASWGKRARVHNWDPQKKYILAKMRAVRKWLTLDKNFRVLIIPSYTIVNQKRFQKVLRNNLNGKGFTKQTFFGTRYIFYAMRLGDGFEPLQNHISCPSPNSQNRVKTKSVRWNVARIFSKIQKWKTAQRGRSKIIRGWLTVTDTPKKNS